MVEFVVASFLDKLMGTDQVQAPPAAKMASPLPNTSVDDIYKIAGQTRNLLPNEKSKVQQIFGSAVDSNNARVGFDAGASGTNLRGWTDTQIYPTVAFFPPDENTPQALPHEMTHVWQHLTNGRFTGDMPGYKYPSSPTNFLNRGPDQQAEMVQDRRPEADVIKNYPTSPLPRGDVAFLDSVRARMGQKDDDPNARLGSLKGVSHVNRKGGHLSLVEPFQRSER